MNEENKENKMNRRLRNTIELLLPCRCCIDKGTPIVYSGILADENFNYEVRTTIFTLDSKLEVKKLYDNVDGEELDDLSIVCGRCGKDLVQLSPLLFSNK